MSVYIGALITLTQLPGNSVKGKEKKDNKRSDHRLEPPNTCGISGLWPVQNKDVFGFWPQIRMAGLVSAVSAIKLPVFTSVAFSFGHAQPSYYYLGAEILGTHSETNRSLGL